MLAIFFPFQKNSFFVLSLFFCHTVPRTNVDFWKGNYVLCSRFFSFLESEIKYFQGSFIVVVVVTKDRWSRTEIESESHPPERPFVVDTDVVYGVIQTRHAFIVPFVEVRIPTPNRRINTCPACSMIVFLWISCLIYQAMKVVVSVCCLCLPVLLKGPARTLTYLHPPMEFIWRDAARQECEQNERRV